MSFKFDFCVDTDETTESEGTSASINLSAIREDHHGCISECDRHENPATEIVLDYAHLQELANSGRIRERRKEILTLANSHHVTYLDTSDVEQEIKQDEDKTSAVKLAISSQSDLVPSVYEGGLQIWECSFDLIQFLTQQCCEFSQLRVLEIGCGAGLPGCYALSRGAVVNFQDFNADVIDSITIPNAALNLPASQSPDGINQSPDGMLHFYSGDWSQITKLCCGQLRYDMILTSETIYNQQSYSKLHDLIEATLKPTGIVYIAAKAFYFGVGGGTRDFESFVRQRSVFKISSILSITDRGVKREILEMTFSN